MNNALIVFDTETTGLLLHPKAPIAKQPKIIEFGIVLLDAETGEELEEHSIFINPMQQISAEITKITGITDADVRDAPTFQEALPQLRSIFARGSCVCAHNLRFDKGMLFNELVRNDVVEFPWPAREFCTLSLYANEWGRMPKLLELYAAKLGRALAQTHRALDDARALAEIVIQEKLYELA